MITGIVVWIFVIFVNGFVPGFCRDGAPFLIEFLLIDPKHFVGADAVGHGFVGDRAKVKERRPFKSYG